MQIFSYVILAIFILNTLLNLYDSNISATLGWLSAGITQITVIMLSNQQ